MISKAIFCGLYSNTLRERDIEIYRDTYREIHTHIHTHASIRHCINNSTKLLYTNNMTAIHPFFQYQT